MQPLLRHLSNHLHHSCLDFSIRKGIFSDIHQHQGDVVAAGKFFVEQVLVETVCFPYLPLEAVARYGCFKMALGYGNHNLDRLVVCSRIGRRRVFQPYHPKRISHIRVAVLKQAADQCPAFQALGPGKGVDWSVHKFSIESSTIQK